MIVVRVGRAPHPLVSELSIATAFLHVETDSGFRYTCMCGYGVMGCVCIPSLLSLPASPPSPVHTCTCTVQVAP